MTEREPRRLLEESPSELVRSLLGAGDRDRPEAGAADRALASLGLGALVPPATSVAPAPAAPTAKVVATKSLAVALAKWPVIAALGGAAALGSASAQWIAPHTAHVAPSQAVPLAATPAITTAVPVAPTTPSPTSVTLPAEPPPPRASERGGLTAIRPTPLKAPDPVEPAVVPSPPPAPAASSMMDQLAALHAIRSDVEAGEAARALARIDAFDASYAGSSLREEVMVLRAEALARAGREAEARSAASAFFRSFPTSPYGPRVRAVVHTP